MIKIRRNVFETNSSSTHSITMCMESEYDAWKRGELYLCICEYGFSDICRAVKTAGFKAEQFYPVEEVKKWYKDHGFEFYTFTDIEEAEDKYSSEDSENVCFISYDERWHWYKKSNEYFETYASTYTTPSGENIVAFGAYGHD